MPKKIKVVITAVVDELPEAAEVIRFKDEDGCESDHLKFGGMIIRPTVHWLQYVSSDITKKKYKDIDFDSIGWESVSDDTFNDFFACEQEDWYMEESQ